MPDRDRDLVGLFVRDLDTIELPDRERWRPAPRKESAVMTTTRYIASAAAVATLVVLGLIASFGPRDGSAGRPASVSPSLEGPPSVATPVPTGVITGRISYPSPGFIPPVTVYAIDVGDENVWFSTDTAIGEGTYRLVVPVGTYWVRAYRNDDPAAEENAFAFSTHAVAVWTGTTRTADLTTWGCKPGIPYREECDGYTPRPR